MEKYDTQPDQPIEDGNEYESEDDDQGVVENEEEVVAAIVDDKHQELYQSIMFTN